MIKANLQTQGPHFGEWLLFNHPAFLKFVDNVIYGPGGIATKWAVNFTAPYFPLPPLAAIASIVTIHRLIFLIVWLTTSFVTS